MLALVARGTVNAVSERAFGGATGRYASGMSHLATCLNGLCAAKSFLLLVEPTFRELLHQP
jgi:hypothetical protein